MCAKATDLPPSSTQQVVEVLDAFLQVQQQRAQYYHRFDDAHRLFIRTKAEGPFRHVMAQLTQQFNQCSQEVIALQQRLSGPLGLPQTADLLGELQGQERRKLQLTLSLQALKAAHAHRQFSWQEEEGGGEGVGGGTPDHVCGLGCGHAAPRNEPSQAEYEGAVRESYQQLQEAVTSINDIIVELQQLRADVLGEEGPAADG